MTTTTSSTAAIREAVNGLPGGRRDPADWQTLLQRTAKGRIVASAANAATILRHDTRWRGVLEFSERTGDVVIARVPPFPADLRDPRDTFPRAVLDADLTRIAADLARTYDATIGAEAISAALDVVARERPRDPVREYLDALRWDGVERLDAWCERYLGAQATPYTRQVGARWLISAVARAYAPGCQADHVLVLEGPQGSGKSSAIRALVPHESLFTDELRDLRDKDAADSLRGPWIVEIAELDAMQRSELTTVKAFVSRRVDRFRPAYGRRTIDFARRCVFAASTNESAYLRDPTGARRFWPVRCGRIDLDGLRAARDQLWAEAATRFRAGATWHPDAVLAVLAGEQQEGRYQGDAWEDAIAAYLDGRAEVTIREVASDALEIEIARLTQADQNRIARALGRLGWATSGNPVRRVVDGKAARVRVYSAPPEAT